MPSPIRSISESSTIPDFSVVLFGAAGVGKSALVRRFLKNSFSEIYRPTVEETYSTVLQTVSCTCVRLVLIDTAGLHTFPAMRELRMRSGNAFIFVFSYDSTDSLQEAIRLYSNLQRIKGTQFGPKNVVFAGNKADLLTVPSIIEYAAEDEIVGEDSKTSRCSSGEESSSVMCSVLSAAASAEADELRKTVRSLIEQLGCPLIDTSARIGCNVLEVFHSVLFPMLFAHSYLAGRLAPVYVASSHFREDSPIRGAPENVAISKKISWPWRCASDHPTAFPFHPNLNLSKHSSPNRSKFHLERNRKISCVENNIFIGENNSHPASRDEFNRKFSTGSRLLVSPRKHSHYYRKNRSNNQLSINNDTYNRPAPRSLSVDNSLADKANIFRDTNPTESANSGRIYSSLSSVEKENMCKLSVSSADPRYKHGRFISPSPRRSSRECELALDLGLHSLDFVQEVGHHLDPSHRTKDASEPRVPCFQILNCEQRRKSPQPPSLNRERVKKFSFFSRSSFCRVDHVCKANEFKSLRSEHELNLVISNSHNQSINEGRTKSANCKVS